MARVKSAESLYLVRCRSDLGSDTEPNPGNPWEPWPDKCTGVVVKATDESMARSRADAVGLEEKTKQPDCWLNSDYSECILLASDITLDAAALPIVVLDQYAKPGA